MFWVKTLQCSALKGPPKERRSECLELIKHAVATPFCTPFCHMTKCTNTSQTSWKWWVWPSFAFWISWHHQDTNFQQLLFFLSWFEYFPTKSSCLGWLCAQNAPGVGSHVTHPSFWTLLSLSFLFQKNGQTSQYHRVTTSYLFKSNNKQKMCWLIWLLGCVSKHLNSFLTRRRDGLEIPTRRYYDRADPAPRFSGSAGSSGLHLWHLRCWISGSLGQDRFPSTKSMQMHTFEWSTVL